MQAESPKKRATTERIGQRQNKAASRLTTQHKATHVRNTQAPLQPSKNGARESVGGRRNKYNHEPGNCENKGRLEIRHKAW